MKTTLTLLFALIACSLWAQQFALDTLVYNGDIDRRINLVILSEGYTEAQLTKFSADAQSFTDALFAEPPFREYRNYFNVFTINVTSKESGADHPGTASDVSEPAHPVATVDTYFDATFDFAGIHRLLASQRNATITNVLALNFPLYDQAFILVNSPHYGGSGGVYPVSSTNTAANEIAIHELGHSFANLADEYYAGDNFARESFNMTQETNPTRVKWKNWHGEQGIGIYQHCCGGMSSSWYRPHEDCKMRFLGRAFCAVCKEAIIERIHNLISPIEAFLPVEQNVFADDMPLKFALDLIESEPNTLKINWQLNGEQFASDMDEISVESHELLSGENILIATVHDETPLQRIDGHADIHLYQVTWNIQNAVTGINDIRGKLERLEIQIFPNPTINVFTIALKMKTTALLQIELFDSKGQLLAAPHRASQQSGDQQFSIDLSPYPLGSYFIKIWINGYAITRQVQKMD